MPKKYDIAISFAGEDREIALSIASKLTSQGVSVFYDEFEKADLWGKDLYEHLIVVYKDNSKYCLMLLSDNYAKKLWPTHERKAAQARAFKENSVYILPLRLDDTNVPGVLETTGYMDYRKETADSVADQLLIKLWGDLDNDAVIQILKEKLEDLYNRMMLTCDLSFMPADHPQINQHGAAMEMYTGAIERFQRVKMDLQINSVQTDHLVLSQLTEVLDSIEKILKRAHFLLCLDDPKRKNLDFISEIPRDEFEIVYRFLSKLKIFNVYELENRKFYTPNEIINNWEKAEIENNRYYSDPKKFEPSLGRTPFVFNFATMRALNTEKIKNGDRCLFYEDSN